MKVLVTGGTGYIGSHTVVELQLAGYDVIIIDNLSNSHIEVLDGIEKITGIRPQFEKIDITDFTALNGFFVNNKNIDSIIHFAALKAVGESVMNPVKYYFNNIGGNINLVKLAIDNGIKNFVFSSSCTVYGETTDLPVTEQSEIKPAFSPYGYTKQVSEQLLRDASIASGINVITLRYFNPIGAHDSALIGELPEGVPDNLVPFITQTAIGKRELLIINGNDYDTPDGTNIRDYIHVVDLAKAHLIALKRLSEGNNETKFEIFNLGTGRGHSVLEIVNTFEKVTGEKLKYRIGPRREGDITSIYSDTKKANQVLGWKAERDLENMLLSAWNWEKANSGVKK
jgi:UDP-glucose 4-epimerase